jgi:hypothetical protein
MLSRERTETNVKIQYDRKQASPDQGYHVQAPSNSLPKGDGTIRGIGE